MAPLAVIGSFWGVRRIKTDTDVQRLVLAAVTFLAAYGGFFLVTRTSFIFYMTAVVPTLALMLGGALAILAERPLGRLTTVFAVVLAFTGFLLYEPYVSAEWMSRIRFEEAFATIPWMDP